MSALTSQFATMVRDGRQYLNVEFVRRLVIGLRNGAELPEMDRDLSLVLQDVADDLERWVNQVEP